MRSRSIVSIVLSNGILLLPSFARADHACVGFGIGGSGPIHTIAASTLDRGQVAASLRHEHTRFHGYTDPVLLDLAAAGVEHPESTDALTSTFLSIAGGVSRRLTLVGRLPYLHRSHLGAAHRHPAEEPGEPDELEVEREGDSAGVGDLTVLGLYRVTGDRPRGTRFALLGGAKLDTGDTGVRSRSGEPFEPDHQPGSGSTDLLVGLALSQVFERFSLHASVLEHRAGRGSGGVDLGDALAYGLGLVVPLSSGPDRADCGCPAPGPGGAPRTSDVHGHDQASWELVLEIHGENRGRIREADGSFDPHHGGSILYVSPGLRVNLPGGRALFGGAGIPIHDAPNGAGLSTDHRLTVGFATTFR